MPAPWLPISHQKQRHRSDCLAACAAIVLNYPGRPIRYARLMKLLDITPDLGAPASNIKRLAEKRRTEARLRARAEAQGLGCESISEEMFMALVPRGIAQVWRKCTSYETQS